LFITDDAPAVQVDRTESWGIRGTDVSVPDSEGNKRLWRPFRPGILLAMIERKKLTVRR